MLEHALRYARSGLHVFPIRGKRPLPGSRGHTDATTDAEQIRIWWKRSPDLGIGIATGARSGIWVLDVDPDHEGADSLLLLQCEHDDLPDTATVRTGGGGEHYWFKWDPDAPIRNSAGRIAPGVDVRGEGGYVVAPPSDHPSGGRYTWHNEARTADAPAWLVQLARAQPERGEGGGVARPSANEAIPGGQRNDRLFRLGCALRHHGFDEAALIGALEIVNYANCKPPLGGDEVHQIGRNVCERYGAGSPDGVFDRMEASRALDEWVRGRPPLSGKTHIVMGAELDAQLTARADGIAPVYDREQLWLYDARGLWSPLSGRVLHRTVQRWEGRKYVTGADKDGKPTHGRLKLDRSHVVGSCESLRDRAVRPGFFDDAPAGVAVQNGFVRVRDGRIDLLGHSPDHRATKVAPCAWVSPAPAPRWDQFVGEIFAGTDDADDRARLLGEFFGATLCGLATTYQRALVLHGPGGNGKSQAIAVLSGLLPPGTVSSVPPHKMGEEYWVSRLSGSWLNAHADLPTKRMAAGPLKELIAPGDCRISARDPRGLVYDFRPRAAHIFSCNVLPASTDTSQGFWDRFLPVGMPNRFRGRGGEVRDLAAAMLRDERDGIFAWALSGAARLLANGGYTVPASTLETLEGWREDADRVANWIRECCVPAVRSQGARVADLRESFVEWDRRHGGTGRMSALIFRQRLEAVGFSATKVQGVRGTTLLRVNTPLASPHPWVELGDLAAKRAVRA